jgi:hypothetical protein
MIGRLRVASKPKKGSVAADISVNLPRRRERHSRGDANGRRTLGHGGQYLSGRLPASSRSRPPSKAWGKWRRSALCRIGFTLADDGYAGGRRARRMVTRIPKPAAPVVAAGATICIPRPFYFSFSHCSSFAERASGNSAILQALGKDIPYELRIGGRVNTCFDDSKVAQRSTTATRSACTRTPCRRSNATAKVQRTRR